MQNVHIFTKTEVRLRAQESGCPLRCPLLCRWRCTKHTQTHTLVWAPRGQATLSPNMQQHPGAVGISPLLLTVAISVGGHPGGRAWCQLALLAVCPGVHRKQRGGAHSCRPLAWRSPQTVGAQAEVYPASLCVRAGIGLELISAPFSFHLFVSILGGDKGGGRSWDVLYWFENKYSY